MVRLNSPAGTLDSSYGSGTGGSRVDVGNYISGGTSTDDLARSVAVQPDGKILVGGSTTARGTRDFAVVRLRSPEGTLDPSFGADGHGAAVIDLGGENEGRQMALQANGKILVAGTTVDGGQTDPAVIRSPNGTLDTSFGDGGERVIEIAGTQQVNALAIAPDGKIVVAGTTGETPAVTDHVRASQPAGRRSAQQPAAGRRVVEVVAAAAGSKVPTLRWQARHGHRGDQPQGAPQGHQARPDVIVALGGQRLRSTGGAATTSSAQARVTTRVAGGDRQRPPLRPVRQGPASSGGPG